VTGRLAVAVVGYDSAADIADVVGRARALPEVSEVVVVDHGTDGTAAIAQAAGAHALHHPENPGFGAGQNRAIRETRTEYVLLLNPDAVPDPAGIAAGLAALDADATVGAVQGVIVNRGTGEPERSQGREVGPVHLVGRAIGAKALLRSRSVRALARRVGAVADHADRVPETARSVESLAATCVIVRRAAFDAVGGFDESYFLYGEDLDLCRRLRGAGWTLLALPDRFAEHVSGGSAASAVGRELTWWRGTMQFAAQWWSPTDFAVAVAAAVVRWCVLAVRAPTLAGRAWRALVREPLRDRAQGHSRSRAALAHPCP
jgi:GT2 family glycosyltransferase